jgi:hypothetical protein
VSTPPCYMASFSDLIAVIAPGMTMPGLFMRACISGLLLES